jgi:energy-coupling factor transporter transmembrane protein EcfT
MKRRNILMTIGFTLLLVLLFVVVLVLMVSGGERWFAFLILAACVGLLVFLRSTKFWRGWRVPLCFILTLVIAWIGLFAGQPSTNIQAYTLQKLEQPSASYELLLNNLTIVDTQTGNLTSNMSILCSDGKIKDIAPAGTIIVDNDTTGDIMTPMNATTPEIAVEFVRQQQKAGAGFIKIGGVSPDVFHAIQEEANKLGIPAAGHVLPDMDLKEVSKNGFKSIEHFGINFGALISCSTDEKALRMQATGIPTKFTENPIFVQFMKIRGIQRFVNEQFIKWGTKTSGGANDETQLAHIIDTYSEEKANELGEVYVQNNTWQCPTMVRMHAGVFSGNDEATSQSLYNLYLSLVKTYDLKGVKMMVGTDGSQGDVGVIDNEK